MAMTDEQRIRRLERALAQLTEDSYALSSPAQLENKGKPDLAAVLDEYRSGQLGPVDDGPRTGSPDRMTGR